MIKGVFHPLNISRAQTHFSRTMKDQDPFILFRDSIRNLSRSIGGIIIHDKQVARPGSLENLPVNPFNIPFFIVGGNDNNGFAFKVHDILRVSKSGQWGMGTMVKPFCLRKKATDRWAWAAISQTGR